MVSAMEQVREVASRCTDVSLATPVAEVAAVAVAALPSQITSAKVYGRSLHFSLQPRHVWAGALHEVWLPHDRLPQETFVERRGEAVAVGLEHM